MITNIFPLMQIYLLLSVVIYLYLQMNTTMAVRVEKI